MYISNFNTGTLAYKLLSGSLKKNRIHSEQLNKYLAGLLDTDGCISLFFYKTRTTNKQKVSVTVNLTQAAVNDPDFETLRSLQAFYEIGSLSYSSRDVGNETSTCSWTIRDRESKILFNRVGKHLRLKATHFDNLIWISNEHKDIEDIPECIVEELKEFSKCSNINTRWMKIPKHLSWAYVAGVIAGDGSISKRKREDKNHFEMKLKITQSLYRREFLKLFKRDFKGNIYKIRTWLDWERNLGVSDSSFAVPFLEKIRQYIIHERKYLIIEDILKVHKEHRQQRLNRENSKE